MKALVLALFSLSLAAVETPKGNEAPFQWSSSQRYRSQFEEQEKLALDPKKEWSTNSLLIIKDDEILFEGYYNGFNRAQKQRIWSISKTFSGALIGVALNKDLFKLSTRVATFYPAFKGQFEKTISIEHLLSMTSGLDWKEGYESSPFASHVIKMLYLDKQKDMATFISERSVTQSPGRIFHYSSGETNLLLGALKKAVANEQVYNEFPWEELFTPLGIKEATWEQDGSGTFVGSSYLYLRPRDTARFARLYLNKGSWQGKQIIAQSFVQNSLTPTLASCQTLPEDPNLPLSYGWLWWLNGNCPAGAKSKKTRKAFKELPSTLAMGLGHHGQTLAIFPSLNAIAIRTGADKKQSFDREGWLNAVYKVLKKVPSNKEEGAPL